MNFLLTEHTVEDLDLVNCSFEEGLGDDDRIASPNQERNAAVSIACSCSAGEDYIAIYVKPNFGRSRPLNGDSNMVPLTISDIRASRDIVCAIRSEGRPTIAYLTQARYVVGDLEAQLAVEEIEGIPTGMHIGILRIWEIESLVYDWPNA
ncbi:MAG: hypothetical protein RML48_02735 [Candidatus Bipolaricaulota bacterium]|nr:hypothetical protein [Candidatus Bipolaricaulota bacterium]